MKNMIEANFTFYPVGQGCFYAGSIKTKADEFVVLDEFVFVYDCGTVSKEEYLNDAIGEFKKRFNKIDLLIISHFDKDHVNGVKNLLTGIHCEKVIIPYYLPIIRLALFGNSDPDNDYTSFIKDPINYFLDTDKFDVAEVVVLENGNDNEEDFVKAPEPNNPKKELEIFEKITLDQITNNNDGFQKRVLIDEGNEFQASNRVKYMSLPFRPSLSNGLWEFVFYQKDFYNLKGLEKFRVGIDNLILKTKDGKLSSLFDETFIVNIKSLYKKNLSQDINYTSLVMYHGPLPVEAFIKLFVLNNNNYWWPHFRQGKRIGTLLTGDAFLKEDEDFNPFYNYYSPHYIDKCFLFQVPHHGSKRNWKNLPNGLENIPFYIINHGWGRKKHPNKDVVENIIKNKDERLISNSESSKIDYTIIIRK